MNRGLSKRLQHLEALAALTGRLAAPPSDRERACERLAKADPEARDLASRLAARLAEIAPDSLGYDERVSGRTGTSPRAAADMARVIVGDREAAELGNRLARRLAALADQAPARPE